MTILAIAQKCAQRLQLTAPSAFVTSTDNNMLLLNAMIIKTIEEVTTDFAWPELQREYTFTLATSVDSYAFPGDYDIRQNSTLWNRTQHWPLIGPIDAIEWQSYKSGFTTTLPRQRFRVKGSATAQFFIDPTPTSTESGQTCVYEYLSCNIIRPITWITATVFAAATYCWYNGNYYFTSAGGTTGATPPTHTTGSVSDGGVTWIYQNAPYLTALKDTDEIILDNEMIVSGAVWRFKMERGLDYQELKAADDQFLEVTKCRLAGAEPLSMNIHDSLRAPFGIGPWSYPIGNYGV